MGSEGAKDIVPAGTFSRFQNNLHDRLICNKIMAHNDLLYTFCKNHQKKVFHKVSGTAWENDGDVSVVSRQRQLPSCLEWV